MNISVDIGQTQSALRPPPNFDYNAAFSRNIGWLSEWEQNELRTKRVAIAGMGGVGGAHALTLARLGVGELNISDFDRFDIVNMNRQAGAFVSTIGLEKASVMARMASDINPDLRMRVLPNGLTEENIDDFLKGVDLFVDGLDFFVIDIRRKVFERCYELGIPAMTAAPIGFGTTYIVFMPGGMTFEEYFRFQGLSVEKQYVNFALGLTPKGFHRSYLIDQTRLDLDGKRGPSTSAAIQLCSGVVAAEAAKILTKRGRVYAAPYFHQFDPFAGKWSRGRLRFGNNGPLQSLKRKIGYRAFANLSKNARPEEEPAPASEIEQILDSARWAPSGDNAQPWRFQTLSDNTVLIHVRPDLDDIYEYDQGRPTLLATGMLLETMRIAASKLCREMNWAHIKNEGADHTIKVEFARSSNVQEDALCPYIKVRSVDRRSYSVQKLTEEQKCALQAALGSQLNITWHEGFGARLRQSWINMISTDVRLRCEKAYQTHERVIDWNSPFSRGGIPIKAIGLNALSIKLMKWVMASWSRHEFFNRFLLGTLLPRIELDLVPGVHSASHFSITAGPDDQRNNGGAAQIMKYGMRIQRFWLLATKLGLAIQPALSPIIFSYYAKKKDEAFGDSGALRRAKVLAAKLDLKKCTREEWIFRGRIGVPKRMTLPSRSIRHALRNLYS